MGDCKARQSKIPEAALRASLSIFSAAAGSTSGAGGATVDSKVACSDTAKLGQW